MPDTTEPSPDPAGRETPSAPGLTGQNHPAVVRVDDPGQLIVAVPAMLGFTPQRSLVVAVLRDVPPPARGPVIEAVLRFDLDPDSTRQRGLGAMYAQRVTRICATARASQVLAVIVDDRVRQPRPTRGPAAVSPGPWEALIAAFAHGLAQREVFLTRAWAVPAIAAQQRWCSLLGADRRGVLPDPAASMVTVAHVLDGRPIRGARSELTDLVAPDHEVTAQVTALLDRAHALARQRYETAARCGDRDGYHRRALELVLWRIADTDSGAALTAGVCAQLAAALRDRTIRDALFALAVGEYAAAAENLWAALTRALPGSDRAEAAVLLAYSAYLRGDGPLAGIALDAALDADPAHAMANLLDTALRTGMRPETLRRLARSGLRIAADLGIDLGPAIG
ncbi:DUF4192 family protein [Nocardia sp. R7R-8]|uniref:DUF4192 family protein n=1 Tax=Nocardia sp. R7R-8 TaxID=3459304 RepID=UPI00403DB408